MTLAVVILGVLSLLLTASLIFRESEHAKHILERERAWDLERGALLTRIQHPEVYIPAPVEMTTEDREKIELAEKELADDEIDLIGTVVDGPQEESLNG